MYYHFTISYRIFINTRVCRTRSFTQPHIANLRYGGLKQRSRIAAARRSRAKISARRTRKVQV